MNDPVKYVFDSLNEALTKAYRECVKYGELPDGAAQPEFEEPKDKANGDFSTSFAMKNARLFRLPPVKAAQLLLNRMPADNTIIKSAETAGAGFINFRIKNDWLLTVIKAVEELGEGYGKSDCGKGQRIMVEFVSANPTGPMHLGNARGGVLGDSLSSLLQCAGYNVYREFYVNDAGNQVVLFSQSLEARYLQELLGEDAAEFPEDGYHGDDIRDLAKEFIAEFGDKYVSASAEERREALARFGLEKNIKRMQDDLLAYGVKYDNWFFESTLHESGYLKETVDLLTKKGYTYMKDGALWLKSTLFGCEKDDVLVRENGLYTYYAADIAYHRNKFTVRNFDKVIDILGADHHGHIVRFKAGIAALDVDPERLDFVIMQFVRLLQDGQAVKMSKRTGKAITLSTLLSEISVDAARFFFNMRPYSTHLDFDLSLAVRQDSDNPVYYVQYAYARICTMLKALAEEGITYRGACSIKPEAYSCAEEKEVVELIASYPGLIVEAAKAYDPSKITRYTIDLAAAFHKFYNSCRIKGENDDVIQARLGITIAVKQVLANALKILGVSAPEKM